MINVRNGNFHSFFIFSTLMASLTVCPGRYRRRRPGRGLLLPQHDREEARSQRRAEVGAARPAARHVRHLRRQHREGRH